MSAEPTFSYNGLEGSATRGSLTRCDGSIVEWTPEWRAEECECCQCCGCSCGLAEPAYYDTARPKFHVKERVESKRLMRCETCGAQWERIDWLIMQTYSNEMFESVFKSSGFFGALRSGQ